jgi:2'-5' RNA ligase
MPRYFIGLTLPPSIQQRLTAFRATITERLPNGHNYSISWNAPEDLHCTLLYIGPTQDSEDVLTTEMRRVASQLTPTTLTLSGATHWLGRNSVAVAATGAEHPGNTFATELGHLSSDRRVGRRPFYGHVTLARVRPVPPRNTDPFVGHVLDEPLSWRVDCAQLLKSGGGNAAPRYQTVSQARFGATPPGS